MTGLLFYSLIKKSITRKLFYCYIIPGLMVYVGITLNVILTATLAGSPTLLSLLGATFTWILYLMVPYWVGNNSYPLARLWNYFYKFMLVVSIVCLIDYYITFAGLNYLRPVSTSGGVFDSSLVGLFYRARNGILSPRFYAIFLEPGDYALWLLPAISYAFFYKKYAALVLFVYAMYLTASLGGWVGMFILLICIQMISYQGRYRKLWRVCGLAIILFLTVFIGFINEFNTLYNKKGISRIHRKLNVVNGLRRLPEDIIKNPLGSKLYLSTGDMEKNNQSFIGYNFTVLNSYIMGGDLALFGYVFILGYSLFLIMKVFFRSENTRLEKLMIVTALPFLSFVIQRQTLWDSPLFALLYSPFLIKLMLEKVKIRKRYYRRAICTPGKG
ncbi:MAG: hypothetical protein K0U12_07480 [Gammaproteobacteria bacterium]|nr:hypothetical protein [Gammaproteobacteria bacterium]